YFSIGLKTNERCVYVDSFGDQEEVCRQLRAQRIYPESCMRSGQLVFLKKEELYLRERFFSPVRTIDLISEAHYEALKSGFYGLRGAGDISWAAENPPGAAKVPEYESELNNFLKRSRFMAFCQYDEENMPERFLVPAVYTHPRLVIEGVLYDNSYYRAPEAFRPDSSEEYGPGTYRRLRENIVSGQTPGLF
ncbi:MAG: MEDS domain-containing protein, partial [Candidatus Omnitrophica bacterium]|nr:MEDS domain-containing protein [Candidatus Omnitrophota bacterium]